MDESIPDFISGELLVVDRAMKKIFELTNTIRTAERMLQKLREERADLFINLHYKADVPWTHLADMAEMRSDHVAEVAKNRLRNLATKSVS